MPTSHEPLATDVQFHDDKMIVELDDGRTIMIPIEWFPSLRDASTDARENWELIAGGEGIHWPDLDEDLSVLGFLAHDAGPLSRHFPQHRSRSSQLPEENR